MTNAVELLRKILQKGGMCIDNAVKTIQKKITSVALATEEDKDCCKRAFLRKGKDNGRNLN